MHQHRMLGLDALRAAAVLAVMISHAPTAMGAGPTGGISWLGAVGVNAFFALSGYLVGGIALRTVRELGDVPEFWARRWLRTIPAAIFVLAVCSLLMRPPSWEALQTALFVRSMGGGLGSFVPHFWTLAIEEWAYLLLPFAILLVRRHPFAGLLALWAGLVVFREGLAFALGASAEAPTHATLLRIDAIFVGAAVAAANVPPRCGLPLLVTGSVGLLALATLPPWRVLEASAMPALFALTLPALSRWRPAVAGAAWAATLHVASVSYGLYLVHLPIYLGTAALLSGAAPVMALSAAVAASWLAAIALRRCVELPFLSLRDRRPDRSRAVLAAD